MLLLAAGQAERAPTQFLKVDSFVACFIVGHEICGAGDPESQNAHAPAHSTV